MVVTPREREEWAASRGISLWSLGRRRPPEGVDPLAPKPLLLLFICRSCRAELTKYSPPRGRRSRRYCSPACKQCAYRQRRKARFAPPLADLVESAVTTSWLELDQAASAGQTARAAAGRAARQAGALSVAEAEAWLSGTG